VFKYYKLIQNLVLKIYIFTFKFKTVLVKKD